MQVCLRRNRLPNKNLQLYWCNRDLPDFWLWRVWMHMSWNLLSSSINGSSPMSRNKGSLLHEWCWMRRRGSMWMCRDLLQRRSKLSFPMWGTEWKLWELRLWRNWMHYLQPRLHDTSQSALFWKRLWIRRWCRLWRNRLHLCRLLQKCIRLSM